MKKLSMIFLVVTFIVYWTVQCLAQNEVSRDTFAPIAGVYKSNAGDFLSIAKFDLGDGQNRLLFTDFKSGVVRILSPASENNFTGGTGLLVNQPIEIQINFLKNKRDKAASLTWRQNGSARQAAKKVHLRREEVSFRNGEVKLSGTLLTPANKGKHPAVVLLHGSGALNRYSFGPFPDFFLSRGYSVLIYDKRGTGASSGNLEKSTFGDLAADGRAAVEFLKTRKEINSRQIGLCGSSQGGFLAASVAAENPNVAFMINLYGMYVSAWQQELYRAELEMRENNLTRDETAEALAFMKLQFDVGRTGQGWEKFAEQMQPAKNKKWFDYVPKSNSLDELQSDWRNVYSYEPAASLEKVTVPVLALFGALDNSTPVPQTVSNMQKALAVAGNKDFTYKIFPKGNHGLLEAETGVGSEIPKLKKFVPELFDVMTVWLKKRPVVTKNFAPTNNTIVSSAPVPPLVFIHATVIDMAGAKPKPDMTIIVVGNRISVVGKTGKVRVPKNARVINAGGKFLIPGLWDMHAHTFYEGVPDINFPLLIANGITGVRDMNGDFPIEKINQIRSAIASDKILGPRIFAVGQLIDGPRPPRALGANVVSVATVEETRRAVRLLKEQGADFIKVYNRLSAEQLSAIADECKKQKISFVGHVPLRVSAAAASDLGQKSIEHLTGVLEGMSASEQELIDLTKILMGKQQPTAEDSEKVLSARKRTVNDYDEKKAAALFKKFAKNKTWHTPTLVSNRVLSLPADDKRLLEDPRLKYVALKDRKQWSADSRARRAQFEVISERFPKLLETVGKMKRAGVTILAGSDLGASYIFAGSSLHDELALFVEAGLSPLEALQTATINPAKFFGKERELGTIEKGKLADLVLLDANPLADISNTKKISAVVLNGRYLPKESLEKMLANVETTANKK